MQGYLVAIRAPGWPSRQVRSRSLGIPVVGTGSSRGSPEIVWRVSSDLTSAHTAVQWNLSSRLPSTHRINFLSHIINHDIWLYESHFKDNIRKPFADLILITDPRMISHCLTFLGSSKTSKQYSRVESGLWADFNPRVFAYLGDHQQVSFSSDLLQGGSNKMTCS